MPLTGKTFLCLIITAVLLLPAGDKKSLAAGRTVGIDFSRGLKGENIEVKSSEDGVPEIVKAGNVSCLRLDAQKTKLGGMKRGCLYFDVSDAAFKDVKIDCILNVEYIDDTGGIIAAHYDAADNAYAEAPGGGNVMTAGGKTRRAVFLLSSARFGNRENAASDFRLFLRADVKISKVYLTSGGDNAAATFLVECRRLETPPAIGEGFEICFGGLDGGKPEDIGWVDSLLALKFPLFRQLGVTSKETYVRWNLIEREKGKYDFSFYDEQLKIHSRWGIKWVPFIIIGSAYSLPDWFYNSKERADYVCLEHGQKSDVQSLWNPNLPKYIDAFLHEFARHYGNTGAIESILLGITGNYGESIYVATGGDDWTADAHGKYHTHAGYWCGDEYARQSYRKRLREKYPDLAALNAAWGKGFKSFDEIEPTLQAAGRQWLDFVEWYRGSMTDWAEFWVKTTRKYFPKTDIYLVTGGHMPPEHGLDISAQAKMCAKYKAGIRITNEGSNFAQNVSHTRLVASSCKFYKTYFGFEPAAVVNAEGVVGRIYNATASGCRHVHYYENLVCIDPAAAEYWMKYAPLLKRREPRIECALLYPFTSTTLQRRGFPADIQSFRDVADVDWVDERMALDGALANYRILIIGDGDVFPKEALDKIDAWIQEGGALIIQNKAVRDVDGGDGFTKTVLKTDMPMNKAFMSHAHGKGLVIRCISLSAQSLAQVLYGIEKIEGFKPIETIEVDTLNCGVDRVFVTYFEKTALVLNFNAAPVKKKFRTGGEEKEIELPPYSMTEMGK